MGYNVGDVLRKIVVYIILNSTLKNNIFSYDFKLSSFFNMKHKIYKESIHFYKFIFIKKMIMKEIIGEKGYVRLM
jgi:hypothetical protein